MKRPYFTPRISLGLPCLLGVLFIVLLLLATLIPTAFLLREQRLAKPQLSAESLAIACDRPEWLEQHASDQHDFEPISPTPESAQFADDAELANATNLTRTEPYKEYAGTPNSLPKPYTLRWRMGIGIPEQNPLYFQWPQTRPGWYLNWTTGHAQENQLGGLIQNARMAKPDETSLGMSFVPMVRVPKGKLRPAPEKLMALAAQNPGRTWLIGNEPDVEWQDNATPEQYAFAFRCAQAAIRGGDPTAKIGFAGLSQITPLRLQYLNEIWDYYRTVFGQEMEVDVWNMHAFVLREERDSWGVHIPPGLDDVDTGELWEIEDHNDLNLVRGQIELMRRRMRDHGQQDKPLIISEYGILLPSNYGFPLHEVVDFMWGSFDLFNSLRDPDLGLPEDDYRLVQRWVWFSTRYDLYPTGDLFNPDDSAGPLMRAMSAYIEQNMEKPQ